MVKQTNNDNAARDAGQYGVWCQCNGIMGLREAWLKRDEKIRRFETEEQAQQEAKRLTASMNSPYGMASFRYYAKAFNSWD